jgi:hypothetical protein
MSPRKRRDKIKEAKEQAISTFRDVAADEVDETISKMQEQGWAPWTREQFGEMIRLKFIKTD